ncbi:MAG: hypothetical protein M3N25_01700 [Actinomycetota bacterium]|nr:hypothetical protein [Actinomycetota bacterium]
MGVVAYVPDLMDRSKLAAAVPDVAFVGRPGALAPAASGADVVVVDLDRPGVLDVLADVVAAGARVVGFAAHVDATTLEAATARGCRAVPRSRFFRSLPSLLAP